jgi:hypothetical protein
MGSSLDVLLERAHKAHLTPKRLVDTDGWKGRFLTAFYPSFQPSVSTNIFSVSQAF